MKAAAYPGCFPQSGEEILCDLSGESRAIEGVLRPSSRHEALQGLAWAKKGRHQLHPVSCGNNWGFGSKLPVREGAYLLVLSGLKKISLNLEHDFAEVEPGVTQGDLHDALKQAGDSHYFNVTGAGRDTSVLGNALERGIGYFGSRKDDVLDLEVATENGEPFWTKDQSENPHHPGLGPDLTGAFLQSGWGLVLNARIRLRKRPPYMGALLLQLRPGASAASFFEQIVLLCREGFISSVPHVANRRRMLTTFGPYITPAQLSEFNRSASDWSCFAPVSGSRALVDALLGLVQERMSRMATCRLVDSESCKKEPFLAPAIDLALGRPNNFALPGVAFSVFPGLPVPEGNLDEGRAGLIHVTPTCPAAGNSLIQLLDLIDQVRQRFEVPDLPMTVNLLNAGVAAVIISVPFDRDSPVDSERARAFAGYLLCRCLEVGFVPYRLGLAGIQGSMSTARRRLLEKFQACVDPDRVIAPSRYECLWADGPGAEIKAERMNALSMEAIA